MECLVYECVLGLTLGMYLYGYEDRLCSHYCANDEHTLKTSERLTTLGA